MATSARERALDKIARLSSQGLDLVHLWRECSEPIAAAVPHYWAPCWFTLDPATLLITSHFDEGIPELPPEWLEAEYFVDDVHKLADVARSGPGHRAADPLRGRLGLRRALPRAGTTDVR